MVSLCLISCRQDEDKDGPITTIPIDPPNISVQATLIGLVKDQSGKAIEGANVEVDGELVALTNEDGAFRTGEMQMNQYGTNITVSKSGYFLGSKFVQPQNGQRVYTELHLVERSLVGNFSSDIGGSFTTNGGAQINFIEDVIADGNGDAFSGNVNVYAHWYDPSSTDLIFTMPGDLRAVNADQQFQQLGTYGMMAVELEDDNGNDLNLLDGKHANLTFPIPDVMVSNAPTTIPLWHFDEGSGYWLEDGEAPLINGTYEARVSHFSFWNCDIPENFIELTGSITDLNSNPMHLTRVRFIAEDATFGYAWIQTDGTYSLKVPKNNLLIMEVLDYCGEVIHSENLGPFSDDTTHPNVNVTNPGDGYTLVEGSLRKCDGTTPLVNGYLKIESENGEYYLLPPDANGEISLPYYNCDQVLNIELTAYDYDDALRSDPVILPIPTSGTVDFGIISTCELIDEYFNFEYQSETYSILDPEAVWDGGPIISGTNLDSTTVNLYFQDPPLNVITNPDYMSLGGITQNDIFFWASCQGCQQMNVTFTEVANNVGEYYEGNFDGILDVNGVAEQFSGEFRVEREN